MLAVKIPFFSTQECWRFATKHVLTKFALSAIGDKSFLSELLPEADKLGSMPGVKASGGDIEVWRQAQPNVALELARKRLQENPKRFSLVLSIKTIGRFGDSSDVDLLESLLQSDEHPQKLAAAFYSLYDLDPQKAIDRISSLIGKIDWHTEIQILGVLYQLGHDMIDYEHLLSIALDDYIEQFDLSDKNIKIGYKGTVHAALELLKTCDLNESIINIIVDRLQKETNRVVRDRLWALAITHQIEAVDNIAQEAVVNGNIDEVGNATCFALERAWSAEENEHFLISAQNRLEIDNLLWTEYGYKELLSFLVVQGEVRDVARVIRERLSDLFTLMKCNINGEALELSATINIFQDCKDPNEVTRIIERQMIGFVIIAAEIPEYLDKSIIKQLLHISGLRNWKEAPSAFRNLLRQLTDEEIDQELKTVQNHFWRRWLLRVVSGFTSTQTRLQLLEEELTLSYPWPQDTFIEIINNLWSLETLKVLLNITIHASWVNESNYVNHYRKVVYTVSTKITKDWAIQFIEPELKKEDLCGTRRNILQFWYDSGVTRRG